MAMEVCHLTCAESREALLTDDGIQHLRGRACEATSNHVCALAEAHVGAVRGTERAN